MGKNVYIREIILAATEPKLCPICAKEDRFVRDLVFERRSNGKTVLCARCEALVVITNQNLKQVELECVKDCIVMLKEPHLIRRVTY